MKTLMVALSSTFLLGGVALAEGPAKDIGTPESTLLEGLKLIRDNKWDDWMSKYCSKDKLCLNDNSRRSLKTYNLPAMQRRSGKCIKADGKLVVKRTEEIAPDQKKIFIQCEDTAMPVPFYIGLENGKWQFLGL